MSKSKSVSDEDTMFCGDNSLQIRLGDVCSQVLQLMGEVLTIIDASIVEKQQNKSIKDLIKSRFYSRNGKITREIFERNEIDWEKATTPQYGIDPEKDGVSEEEIMKMAGADSKHL